MQKLLTELKHQTAKELFQQGYSKYEQIRGCYGLGSKRCAVGVVLSEQGWDGKAPFHINNNVFHEFFAMTSMNDTLGLSFSDIAKTL